MSSPIGSLTASLLFAAGSVMSGNGTGVPARPTAVYDLVMKDIDGKEVPLSRYRGKVLLIVNVASQCGLTP